MTTPNDRVKAMRDRRKAAGMVWFSAQMPQDMKTLLMRIMRSTEEEQKAVRDMVSWFGYR